MFKEKEVMTVISKSFIGNLVEAIPYIERFRNKIFVIKFGGSIMNSHKHKEAFIEDVLLLMHMGIKIVLVHGGGKHITSHLKKMGIETEFVDGYRVTNDEMIKEVEMVLSGDINNELVLQFNNRGINAVGVSGKDSGMILSKRKSLMKNDEFIDIGHVGEVEKIDASYLELLMDHQYLPIISPIGFDQNGITYNINADDVAGKICSALTAEKLILMTDVKGLYEHFGDESTFISKLTVEEAEMFIVTGLLKDGMIPKIKSCITSLKEGTQTTHIINGMTEHSLLLEIFSDEGIGTMVV